MLKHFTKGVCAAALASTFMATAAQAETHNVLIMDGGFFPAVSYVKPGDNIVFTNNSGESLQLAATDSSWTSEILNVDENHSLHITSGIVLDFVAVSEEAAVQSNEGLEDQEYINLDDVLMEGAMSFNPAPLDND